MKSILIGLGLLGLAGCSFLQPSGEVVKTEPIDEQIVESTAEISVAEVRPVNPYLANRKSVSATAKKRFSTALDSMDAAQWSTAEQQLLQLTVDYPELSGAHLNLGICYRQLEKPALAEDYFKQSIAINENNLDAYNWLALVKREKGEFKEAEALYQQALIIWPDHAATHYNLAVLNELYLGDLSSAQQHFVRYQELQPQPDKKVTGWLKDLQRRIKALAKNKAT